MKHPTPEQVSTALKHVADVFQRSAQVHLGYAASDNTFIAGSLTIGDLRVLEAVANYCYRPEYKPEPSAGSDSPS